uniref:Uncharacterized protein n=1 Tax=Oryza rufipogon TaxID=4529 RepID=A0A0E0MSN1_ORYRU
MAEVPDRIYESICWSSANHLNLSGFMVKDSGLSGAQELGKRITPWLQLATLKAPPGTNSGYGFGLLLTMTPPHPSPSASPSSPASSFLHSRYQAASNIGMIQEEGVATWVRRWVGGGRWAVGGGVTVTL